MIRKLLLLTSLAVFLISMNSCGSEPGNRLDEMNPPSSTVTVSRPARTAPEPPAASQRSAPEGLEAGLKSLMAAYDVDREFAHIVELASDRYQGRESGSAGAQAAAEYISSQFSSLGLVPWSELGLDTYAHHFSLGGVEDDNIVGIVRGSGSGFVILAAHYDHLGLDQFGQAYNGADDNAAGVAAVLEAATILKQTGIRPTKSIVFCAFSGEEQGQFGASALAGLIAAQGLADSVEMINIDGIGATGGDYFGVWDEGASNTSQLVGSLKEAGAYLETEVREEGTDIGSDAQAFVWQYGIAAVTVDWHWGQDESAYHPYYHTTGDDPEKISKAALARASRLAIGGLWLRSSSPV